jgi:hypothetical protein
VLAANRQQALPAAAVRSFQTSASAWQSALVEALG